MKTREDFINFYNNNFRNTVNDDYEIYHNIYNNKKNKIILKQLFLLFLIIILVVLFINDLLDTYLFIILLLFFILLFAFMLITNLKILRKSKETCIYFINDCIYRNIISFISDGNYIFEGNTQLSSEDFMKMELFNLNILKYSGNNFTASRCLGKPFLCCDTTLYDLKERMKTDRYYNSNENTEYIYHYHYHEKINIFQGLYYETTIKRKNNQYIYLIPNNIKDLFVRKNINYYISYHGERVKLENLEFEEKYNVYSVDEVKSRYILSVTLMEKINMLDKRIPNKKYLVFKNDGGLGIFIDGYTIDKLLSQHFSFQNVPSRAYLIHFFEKVNDLFWICSIFDED